MEETTLFNAGAITVTTARYINGNTTYAIRNLTSVRQEVQRAISKRAAYIVLAIGLVACVANIILGLLIMAGGLGMYLDKNKCKVILVTASGESTGLTTNDIALSEAVTNAINQAMVSH